MEGTKLISSVKERIAQLERAHYDLMRVSLASLEGAEIRDLGYAVIMSDSVLKIPFTNHANCVNVKESETEGLIDEVVEYFSVRGRPPHFFISPTTHPADFAERLVARGFGRLSDELAWMVYQEGCQVDVKPNTETVIETVHERTIGVFNSIRTGAFGTPPAIASAFTEVYTRTVSRKAITHYVAYLDGKPVGTTTLISAKGVGGIFNVGTLEGYRRRGVATSLMLRAIADSKAKGSHTIFLSVIKDSGAERLYENLGFRRLFVQASYHLFRRR